MNMNNHKTKKRSKSITSADEIQIQDTKCNKKDKTEKIDKDKTEKIDKKEVIKSKRNRPRIFSRDFNQLPVSCSPPC